MTRNTGLIGLAVMGQNLALNIERNGYPMAVYNRTWAHTESFMNDSAKDKDIIAASTIEEFVNLLEKPRRIILLVKAGPPVDAVLDELRPLLDPDDIVVDGGNSLFTDTERRSAETAGDFQFFGMGISGGEEGALNGPSLMPGGPAEAYAELEPMLIAISAKSSTGPCVTHLGPGGSGHYVKMVHNGIEYGDMQLIAEVYDLMSRHLGMGAGEIGKVFEEWNSARLESYLVEITAQVLEVTDSETDNPLVDMILDTAQQKGTGRWTSQSALELGTTIPTIDAAVGARTMSSHKEERVNASKILTGPDPASNDDGPSQEEMINHLEAALYFAKISSYAQGMALLRAASEEYEWNLNLSEVARIWTGGCIIRAELLKPIMEAFSGDPDLVNLLLAPEFASSMNETAPSIREISGQAAGAGIPIPALSAALNYVDSYRTARLPANLIQALRDNFGAHTYRRVDKSGVFHTDWETGETVEIG